MTLFLNGVENIMFNREPDLLTFNDILTYEYPTRYAAYMKVRPVTPLRCDVHERYTPGTLSKIAESLDLSAFARGRYAGTRFSVGDFYIIFDIRYLYILPFVIFILYAVY